MVGKIKIVVKNKRAWTRMMKKRKLRRKEKK